ncbi:hypothetical protein CPB83DRAFT_865509 [Crepidotus variabilis]|uniref:Uncharacterized protein n=1 Tax=Crepidotus variabilis TaxID=179855 RepID=A0A9P6BCQ3_9AGAR|nr:hypothetical protein CPB83DRAFT_865509 [Crepidotus variabilis]
MSVLYEVANELRSSVCTLMSLELRIGQSWMDSGEGSSKCFCDGSKDVDTVVASGIHCSQCRLKNEGLSMLAWPYSNVWIAGFDSGIMRGLGPVGSAGGEGRALHKEALTEESGICEERSVKKRRFMRIAAVVLLRSHQVGFVPCVAVRWTHRCRRKKLGGIRQEVTTEN